MLPARQAASGAELTCIEAQVQFIESPVEGKTCGPGQVPGTVVPELCQLAFLEHCCGHDLACDMIGFCRH